MMVKEDEDVNLEQLEVKPAEMKPVPRGKMPKPNPMAAHVQKSWDENRPLSVEVPAGNAISVGAALRKAAMRLGMGVSVQYHALPEDTYCSETAVKALDPEHLVRVAFRARERIKAARREDDETDD